MSTATASITRHPALAPLNTRYHRVALNTFLVIVIAHRMEHLAQAYHIWVLDWSRADSRGALGAIFPWLVSSEWLHYGYAIVMLVGLGILAPGFAGRARAWWTVAFAQPGGARTHHLHLRSSCRLRGVNTRGAGLRPPRCSRRPGSVRRSWQPRCPAGPVPHWPGW